MITINILERAGEFAENKDIAKELRIRDIIPALLDGKKVQINFNGVSGTTQSFVHALIAESIRQFGNRALENLEYAGCSDNVKEIIKTVYEYIQESLGD